MGTTYHITLENKGDIQALQAAIDKELKNINQLMSTYIDDSELVKFNQSKSTECQALSPQTQKVIKAAVEVSRQTGGKFDVTLAPLIELWGFDKKDTHSQIPPQAEIERELKQIGYQKIELQDSCVGKAIPELSINLSAIAKGYGVDKIAEIIAQAGHQNYLVEIGGEIALKGVNAKAQAWKIAVESPVSEGRSIQKVITPGNMAVATSGDYRNYFEKDGKRYSHTIDPTTGYPITHRLASVTVLHPQSMMADALATAMMVMGEKAALEFAEKQQLPLFILVKTEKGFKEEYSSAFEPYFFKE